MGGKGILLMNTAARWLILGSAGRGLADMSKIGLSSLADRGRVAAALLAMGLVSAAPWATALTHSERHETKHEIDQLEEQWRSALVTRNVPAMDALLSEDYMAITPNGMLQSKDEALANLRSGTVRITSLELSDRKVRFYGSTALVTSRAEMSGTSAQGNISGSYRYTRVYVRDSVGTWRIVSFEASRIRNPGER